MIEHTVPIPLPCPFCGGDVDVECSYVKKIPLWACVCQTLECEAAISGASTQEAALRAWNRRILLPNTTSKQ